MTRKYSLLILMSVICFWNTYASAQQPVRAIGDEVVVADSLKWNYVSSKFSTKDRISYTGGRLLTKKSYQEPFAFSVIDMDSVKLLATLTIDFGDSGYSAKGWMIYARDSRFAHTNNFAILAIPNYPPLKTANVRGRDQAQRVGVAMVFDLKTNKQLQLLLPPDQTGDQHFGCCVDLEGETVLVGSGTNYHKQSNTEAIYLFHARTGKLLHKLLPPHPGTDELFGLNAAIDGDHVVASVIHRKPEGDRLVGYVFDAKSGKLLHTVDCSARRKLQKRLEFASVASRGDIALVGSVSIDMKTGKRLAELPIPPFHSLKSETEQIVDLQENIAIVRAGNEVLLFDVTTGKKIADIRSDVPRKFRGVNSFPVSIVGDYCWIGPLCADIGYLRTK